MLLSCDRDPRGSAAADGGRRLAEPRPRPPLLAAERRSQSRKLECWTNRRAIGGARLRVTRGRTGICAGGITAARTRPDTAGAPTSGAGLEVALDGASVPSASSSQHWRGSLRHSVLRLASACALAQQRPKWVVPIAAQRYVSSWASAGAATNPTARAARRARRPMRAGDGIRAESRAGARPRQGAFSSGPQFVATTRSCGPTARRTGRPPRSTPASARAHRPGSRSR